MRAHGRILEDNGLKTLLPVFTAVSDPEDIPVTAVWRALRLRCLGQVADRIGDQFHLLPDRHIPVHILDDKGSVKVGLDNELDQVKVREPGNCSAPTRVPCIITTLAKLLESFDDVRMQRRLWRDLDVQPSKICGPLKGLWFATRDDSRERESLETMYSN